MACAYVLYSKLANRFYIGSSRENSADKRFKAHNSGKVRSTKFGKPWVIVLSEKFLNYTDARKRENYLKSGQGRQWIKEGWQSGLMRQS
jgi:putative endonuclease